MPKHPSLPAAPPCRHGMWAALGFISVTGAGRDGRRGAALDYCDFFSFFLREKLGPCSYQAMTDKVKHDLVASGATEGPSDGPLRVDGCQVPGWACCGLGSRVLVAFEFLTDVPNR